jgi:hypothetical protein
MPADKETKPRVSIRAWLTKQNIGTHAGVATVVENVTVTYRLPWAPKEERKLVIPRLELHGHTRTWPRQIVEQVADLKKLELAKEAFREAKNNLRVRNSLADWLADCNTESFNRHEQN